ncbi:conserved exported hypothetical protein [Nitrosotalea sinensis]|uniref:Uncharacterized protein n=1 Tax=Nitrosotalea sinensis TaxID=1499975 RepID=A0A2H1EH18_9ARCH|nr:hypothetical protein [Candidatus Nitrosotalea sinensis]SHO45664.1 conserved exported hypothetical protein [Candidatus Nitrosotalea sinensis]
MKDAKKDKMPAKPTKGKGKLIALGVVAAIIAGAAYVIYKSDNTVDTSFASIDGIPCETQEYSTFHIHAHIDIFSNGQHVGIPAQIGLEKTCLYWLHTHTSDGIIHIESPKQQDFTVGQFLDIWKATNTGIPSSGTPEVFVNGNLVSTSLASTIMHAHDEIALVYGDVPQNMPTFYQFPEGD